MNTENFCGNTLQQLGWVEVADGLPPGPGHQLAGKLPLMPAAIFTCG
jgi:hypothetical protein